MRRLIRKMCEEAKPKIFFVTNEMMDKTSEYVKVRKRKRKWAGLRLSKLSTAQHEWITEILKDQLQPGKPTCYRKLDLLVVLISLPSFLPPYWARVPGVPLKFTNPVYHGRTADLPPLNELIPQNRGNTICERNRSCKNSKKLANF